MNLRALYEWKTYWPVEGLSASQERPVGQRFVFCAIRAPSVLKLTSQQLLY
jgi:hypothetical protein